MSWRQLQLFVLLIFSTICTSSLQAQDSDEDTCNCYKPKANTDYKPTLQVGSQRPGLPFTKTFTLLDNPVESVAYIRAHYNYPSDYTFKCDRYFYGISYSNYDTNLSKADYQVVANEAKALWSLHDSRTGPRLRYFSDFQSMFDYAESWVDFHYRAKNLVYKNFENKKPSFNAEGLQKDLDENAKDKVRYFERIDQDRQYVVFAFEKIHEECLAKHSCLRTLHDSAFLHTSQGNTERAIQATATLIDCSKKQGSQKYLSADTYQQLGMQCALAHEFSQAVEALSQAIEKDPANKKIYLERAFCYFEMGNFDLAIQDYIASGIEVSLVPVAPQEVSYYDFSQGMLKGSLKGMKEGAKSIPGTLLQSVHGAGHLLWAVAQDPIGAPRDMVMAAIEVIECLRAQNLQAIAHLLAPEICELVRDWDKLESYLRGEKMGVILGKYGVEIFSRSFVTRLTGVAQKLKRLNLATNIKVISSSANNKTAILAQARITAKRREYYLHTKSYHYQKLKAENAAGKVDGMTKTKLSDVSLQNLAIRRECYFRSVKVHRDLQGKHIEGHQNYKNLHVDERSTKSLWYPNEEKTDELLRKCAGKGHPIRGTPGEAGYQEIIDCSETIGKHISLNKKNQVPRPPVDTPYAIVHYREGGYAHLVPAHPDKWIQYSS